MDPEKLRREKREKAKERLKKKKERNHPRPATAPPARNVGPRTYTRVDLERRSAVGDGGVGAHPWALSVANRVETVRGPHYGLQIDRQWEKQETRRKYVQPAFTKKALPFGTH